MAIRNDGDRAQQAVDDLSILAGDVPVLQWLTRDGAVHLESTLRAHKCSRNYRLSCASIRQLVEMDIENATVAELIAVEGIHIKTAKVIRLKLHPTERHALLDRHVLRWLREQGIDAPKNSPTSPKSYARLEQALLRLADERGLSPLAFDQMIYANRGKS